MAQAKNALAPRVESSAEAYGKRLNNRARALLDSAFDLIEGRARSGAFDPSAALVAAFERDPLGFIERVRKMTPEADAAPALGSITMNMNALYLAATQQVNAAAAPAPLVVDVTPEAPGYIAGTGGDKPLITQDEW